MVEAIEVGNNVLMIKQDVQRKTKVQARNPT